MKFASLFSGFGLADIGAMQAGCDLLWGVELDPQIAEISKQLNHKVLIQSVTETDFSQLEPPDILWASPPCTNFSTAKIEGKETDLDIELAFAVADAIKSLQPRYFLLENVAAYRHSESLCIIEEALLNYGYKRDRYLLNAADFGVPQTRKRFILRATHTGKLPPLPNPEPWKGWYEAIADLISTLPETQLADWQMKRLPQWISKGLLVSGSERQAARVVLVEGAGARSDRGINFRLGAEPVWSLRASVGANRTTSRLANAVLPGKVVSLTPRALGRFQTLPDWYELPQKNSLACRGIGNGVPCLMSQKIIQSLSYV